VIIFNITAKRSADFVGEKVQYQQHRVKIRVGKVFMLQLCLFINYSFRTFSSQKGKYFLKIQVENHKELDHQTQVNRYDSLGFD
jgi:hypothetical protein